MASDTSVLEMALQYGIAGVVIVALLTGWLVTGKHLSDTAKWGEGWHTLYEFERDARERDRENNKRLWEGVETLLQGLGVSLDQLLEERNENRRFRETVTEWIRQTGLRGNS